MIEDLTIEKLSEYGFTKEQIEMLQNLDNYEVVLLEGKEAFFAANIEKKIYSGEGYYTKKSHKFFPYNDPDLVPQYFKQKQAAYLNAFNLKNQRRNEKYKVLKQLTNQAIQ